MKITKRAAGLGILAAGLCCAVHLRRNIRVPLGEYTRCALYMAVLDDEICRSELEGNRIGGKPICFPERPRSLQGRYRLFLRLNRGKDRKTLQAEVSRMERRLRESKQFLHQPKVDLELELEPPAAEGRGIQPDGM